MMICINHPLDRESAKGPTDQEIRAITEQRVSERNVCCTQLRLDGSTFFVCLVLEVCSYLRTMRVVVVSESSIAFWSVVSDDVSQKSLRQT
jgi:hypothetical protein